MVKVSLGFRAPLGMLMILSIAAFLTRLFPLSISQYPFNNDALTECGMASEILDSGHLRFSSEAHWSTTHSVAIPILNVMLSFVSSAVGTTPFLAGQTLGATVAISTVGVIFLLGTNFSGDVRGGVAAAFAAIMFGSFVFTTGSIWKVMLGINLLAFAVFFYTRRSSLPFRVLTLVVLMVIPFVHHLVSIVAFLLFANLLAWSWLFGILKGTVTRRHLYDTLMIVIPGILAVSYYSFVEFDRYVQFFSPLRTIAMVAGFSALSVVGVTVLSLKNHLRLSLAPVVGLIISAVAIMDYLGLVFPYEASASQSYVALGVASGVVVAVAWYGSEVVIESGSMYRAILVGLLIAPVAVIGFGMLQGFSSQSHQILYRSFDLLDLFLFLGLGAGIAHLSRRHKKLYPIIGCALVVSLAVSFPFGYESETLLGVRHDTQAYEVDAVKWLEHRDSPVIIMTDERLSYISESTSSCKADPALPQLIAVPNGFPNYRWYYTLERSWTTLGVNDYPNGRFVLAESTLQLALESSNVLYLGGPLEDQIIVFLSSDIGGATMLGNSSSRVT